MFLKRVEIEDFKVLKNIDITFEHNFYPKVFPLASENGGGKSTFLQLIFTLLHCSFDESRFEFLQNMLEDYVLPEDAGHKSIAKFTFLHEGEDVELEFFAVSNNIVNGYLRKDQINAYKEALKQSKENLRQSNVYIENKNILINDLPFVINLVEDLKNEKQNEKKEEIKLNIIHFLDDNKYKILGSSEEEVRDLLEYPDNLIKKIEDRIILFNGYGISNIIVEKGARQALKFLADGKNYVIIERPNFLSNCKFSLFYKKSGGNKLKPENLKYEISEKIFLAGPLTQMYHFINKDQRKDFFRLSNGQPLIGTYYSQLQRTKEKLTNFFTFDIVSIEQLKAVFKEKSEEDIDAVLENKKSDNLKIFLDELNQILANKDIKPDRKIENVFFFNKKDKELLKAFSPEDLSHGELKYLSIYLWLKFKNITDAVVLMDEIENNLHLEWQMQIAQDIYAWTPTNQFILATHSFELCTAVTPAHVKEIEPKPTK
jgi:predicted ATPase